MASLFSKANHMCSRPYLIKERNEGKKEGEGERHKEKEKE
jgi:hypothetical protein